MRSGMTILPRQDRFWSPMCGIARHDVWNKRGLYEVIATTETVEALDFFSKGWGHMVAVVDDFGNLVRVGNWLSAGGHP